MARGFLLRFLFRSLRATAVFSTTPLRCVDSRHLFAECPTGFQDAFVFMGIASASLCGGRRSGPDRAASVLWAGITRGQRLPPKPCRPEKAGAPLPWGAAITLRALPLPPRSGARPHSASAAPLSAGTCRQSHRPRQHTPRQHGPEPLQSFPFSVPLLPRDDQSVCDRQHLWM